MKRMTTGLSLALEERRRLRGRAPAHIAIADRFSQLNDTAWRAVTQGQSFFHSADYQKAFERVRPPNIEPRYAIVSDGDRPLAAVCMQIARMDLTQVGNGAAAKAFAKWRSRVEQRVLICGNLLAYGLHGVCVAPDADRSLVWQALTEVLYRVRRAEKLAGSTDLVLIKDLDGAAMSDSAVLRKLSYGAVPTEPNMVLALDASWRTHEDYLKGLVSKYRSDIKNRIFKKFSDAGFTVEPLKDVAAQAETLHALYLQVHGNATFRPFTLPPAYWPGLTEAAGENTVVHVARNGDRLVGFIVTLRDGDTAFAYHIGFDRAVADAGHPIYLRLLHASLEQAIAFGCRRVSFGRTALEPKARMGCQPQPTSIWVRHRHPMLNRLVQPLLKLIEANEAPDFSPFKTSGTPARSPVAKA
jgi:predicted N-acyltransferase